MEAFRSGEGVLGHESAEGTVIDHQYSYPDYPTGRNWKMTA